MEEKFRVSEGEIRLDAPAKFKAIRTDDGRLHCEGAFARDGILEYRKADGTVIRELRRPDVNGDPKTLETFKFLPMTVEHPPTGLLNSKTYKSFAVGMSDSTVKYDSDFGGIVGNCSLFDADAIGFVDRGEKVQLSAGYTCDIKPGKGMWNGQSYDQEQINVKANHLALTSKGRAGADVGLRMDSADCDAGIGMAITGKTHIEKDSRRMAKVRLDNQEYDSIPEMFASAVGVKLQELDDKTHRLDAITSEYDNLLSLTKSLQSDMELLQGRLDGYEIVVDNADLVLSDLGYERTDDGIYEKVDDDEDNDEDVDVEEGETDDDEGVEEYSGEDDDEYYEEGEHMDSVTDRFRAWDEAESILPGIIDEYFDEDMTADDVRRLVVNYVEPELNPASRSDSYVAGVYASYLDEIDEDDDDGDRHDSLNSLISSQGGYHNAGGADDGLMPWEAEIMKNYRAPLTMSKSIGRNQ